MIHQLDDLIQNKIPKIREDLRVQGSNLDKVAKYCEDSYFTSRNKQEALESTQKLTNQALAFVAYQINSFARSFLDLLDLQDAQLAKMESQVNHISQTVNIHQEKVARREIGVLTANRITQREHKILVPANPEKPAKYTRKPIDYSILDDIGHGVKITNSRSKRISGQSQLNGSNTMTLSSSNAPTTKPPTPPQSVRGVRSLSRISKEYRTPAPPVAPPQVPSNYAPNYARNYPKSSDAARRGNGYSTLPPSLAHSATNNTQNINSNFISNTSPSPTPPLPPFPTQETSSPLNDSLPDPPMHLRQSGVEQVVEKPGNASPPLPPPPPPMDQMYSTDRSGNPSDDWIPKNYIEKVVAIYDYSANRYDELTFSENSVIYVIKKNEDGWYEGVMNGITGLFPGNYVEPCV